jgi:hypothetical protein
MYREFRGGGAYCERRHWKTKKEKGRNINLDLRKNAIKPEDR